MDGARDAGIDGAMERAGRGREGGGGASRMLKTWPHGKIELAAKLGRAQMEEEGNKPDKIPSWSPPQVNGLVRTLSQYTSTSVVWNFKTGTSVRTSF